MSGTVSLEKLWEEAYAEDSFEKEILILGIKHSRKIPLDDCTEVDGKLFFRNRQYILEHALLQTCLIRECHDRITSGHPGGAITYLFFSRSYWWPRAYADIKRYVRNCHTCSRNKPSKKISGLVEAYFFFFFFKFYVYMQPLGL